MDDRVPPLFIGGTGRCGTHALAALIAAGGTHAAIPEEIRLHVTAGALPDYVSGSIGRFELIRRLHRIWWRYSPHWSGDRVLGMALVTPRRDWVAALTRTAAAPPRRPRALIARRLLSDLLAPVARSAGTPSWVETTPENCAAAGHISRVFPDARFIDIKRDGRDVACSMLEFGWAPDGFADALSLWEKRMIGAERGLATVPDEQVLRISLEDLVANARERTLERIRDFTRPRDAGGMRRWFEHEITPERARLGRWRRDLPPEEHERAEALHAAAVSRIEAVAELSRAAAAGALAGA